MSEEISYGDIVEVISREEFMKIINKIVKCKGAAGVLQQCIVGNNSAAFAALEHCTKILIRCETQIFEIREMARKDAVLRGKYQSELAGLYLRRVPENETPQWDIYENFLDKCAH